MFTGYFDESGTSTTSRITVVAGFVASVDQWCRFNTAWRSALGAHAISCFHMKHFAHGRKAFESWRDDQTQRDAFFSRLLSAITESASHSFAAVLLSSDYKYVIGDHAKRRRYFGSGYTLCASNCLRAVAAWAMTRNISSRVAYVFDRGHKNSNELLQIFNEADEDVKTGNRLGALTMDRDEDHPGLQAADLLAWELRRNTANQRRGKEGLSRGLAVLAEHPHTWTVLSRTALESVAREEGL